MARLPKGISPLTIPAVILSGASLAWTTWSLVDLLGTGPIGLTVAAGADVVWASVIAAEARSLRITSPIGKDRNLVPAIGWAALLAVAALLVWHGIRAGSIPMAVAGPLLPLGAKVIWLLALADMRDPAALTDDERAVLASMQRGMAFEEEQHRLDMRRREMVAERQLAEVEVDFEIELTRMDKGRELARRRPLDLFASTEPITPIANTDHPADHEPEQIANTPITATTTERPVIAGPPVTSPITDRDQPSIADLARDHVAITPSNADAIRAIRTLRPDAKEDSVAAAVRRARRRTGGMEGGYG